VVKPLLVAILMEEIRPHHPNLNLINLNPNLNHINRLRQYQFNQYSPATERN